VGDERKSQNAADEDDLQGDDRVALIEQGPEKQVEEHRALRYTQAHGGSWAKEAARAWVIGVARLDVNNVFKPRWARPCGSLVRGPNGIER
jgi:hypothetical protein